MTAPAAGGDAATLDFYGRDAAAYADYSERAGSGPMLDRFAALLAPGASVLDFGCGSGWAAGQLRERGFTAVGFDGSTALAAEARRRHGVEVTVGRFEEFGARAAYDGIWASFSLLHDRRAAMPDHLARLCRALVPGGVLYLGLKEGSGEARDSLGRLYTYFDAAEIAGLLDEAGFALLASETEPGTGFDGSPLCALHVLARRG